MQTRWLSPTKHIKTSFKYDANKQHLSSLQMKTMNFSTEATTNTVNLPSAEAEQVSV